MISRFYVPCKSRYRRSSSQYQHFQFGHKSALNAFYTIACVSTITVKAIRRNVWPAGDSSIERANKS